jgi:hypothetical protein
MRAEGVPPRSNTAEPRNPGAMPVFSRGGDLPARKNGDADAFGSYERTPSLPSADKENPRLEKTGIAPGLRGCKGLADKAAIVIG